MMPTNQQPEDPAKIIGQIRESIAKNDSGIIVLPAKPTPDAVAAGTALYMVLTKMGKNVSLVGSSIPESDMLGVDKIKSELTAGGDHLVVSFPYEEGSIDKVDYNFNNERFNLIIVPREGHQKLQPKDVQFTYAGGKIDFIITIDTPNLNAIGEIYTKNQRDFESSTIINIDRHLINASYGMINFVVKTSSSTSELVLKVISAIKGELDRDIATNLYSGIVAATNNFTAYSVNADTFEAIAVLLRAGAVKKPMMQQPMNQFGGGMPPMGGMNPFQQMSPQGFMPQPQMPASPRPMQQPQGGSFTKPAVFQRPQPLPQQNQRRNEQQNSSLPQVEKGPRVQEGQVNTGENEDDLKPRIFSDDEGLI